MFKCFIIFSLETKLYNERHTKHILDKDRVVIQKTLTEVKTHNSQMTREI